MEQCLLSEDHGHDNRRLYILHGMGGIGKTQLAINFAIRHQRHFSSIFWLRGNDKAELYESFTECARRIPEGQIPEQSRRGHAKSEEEKEQVVQDVLGWLRQGDNRSWLVIFDNVDLDPALKDDVQRGSFDVRKYMPGNHGSIIITTRLEGMKEYGKGITLKVVDLPMSRLIFDKWYEQSLGK